MTTSTNHQSAQVSDIAFPEHTFLLRKAPITSPCFGDGNVYGEVRCAGNLSAMSVLRILEIPYQVIEAWQHPTKGWKLLRFTANNPSDLFRLHDACGAPDLENRDIETRQWLAAIAVQTKLTRTDLVKLARQAGIPGRSRMNKDQLASALGINSMPVAA